MSTNSWKISIDFTRSFRQYSVCVYLLLAVSHLPTEFFYFRIAIRGIAQFMKEIMDNLELRMLTKYTLLLMPLSTII